MTEEDINNEIKKNSKRNKTITQNSPYNYTKLEFPKINRPHRKSVNKTQFLKSILKTEDQKEEDLKIMNRVFRHASPADICIQALKKEPVFRTEELIKIISFYLQLLKNFMDIFKGQVESEELNELLYTIASKLKYEHIEKNKFIFKFGDKANKFYIILKGKVSFCVPKLNKHYLNEEEYILYLIKLRFHKENDLIKKNMEANRYTYDLGDNFEQFVMDSLTKHEKQGENIYTEKIYSYFKNLKDIFKAEKEIEKKNKKKDTKEIIYEDIIISDYLERSSLDIINKDAEDAVKNKRKLLEIYRYEKTNTFENGDCFGLVGSNNKSHKRSATAITYEDCELAVLVREEYNEILNKINKKAREKLFKLVSSHKIFLSISKRTFINKYSHMFRYDRYFFNNIIMDDTQIFSKIIMFNSGEFILSVNKNIIELNELIIKMKRIKGKILDIPEEIINKDLKEIKENEKYNLDKKYTSNTINEYIMKKQNLIISTINDKMILGYPDTVEQGTFMPLFNCKCISTSATGYSVEREMINLFKKDHYLRTTPPESVLLKIEFYLKRLLQHKQNMIKRIEILELKDKNILKKINNNDSNSINKSYKENRKDIKINIVNDNTEKDANIELNVEETKQDKSSDTENSENILNITRNNINPINNKNNNIFGFQKEKISSQFEKFFIPGKEQKIKKLALINNIKKNNYYSLDNTITQNNNNKENDNFLTGISKIKQNIKKKMHLLRSVQRQSHKFVLKEKLNNKKIQLKLNKYISKYNYCDLASIFSNNTSRKRSSVLDKYLKKSNDNALDSALKDINKQINYNKKLISILPNVDKTINNTDIINNQNLKIKNISIDNNINNYNKHNLYKKIKNKLILSDNEENSNNSKSTNQKSNNNFNNNSNKKIETSLLFTPNDSKLKYIKLNYNNLSLDLENITNNNKNLNINNNIKTLSNEFYNEYFMNEFNKKHNINIINESENENKKLDNILSYYQKLDNYKINKLQLMNIKKDREIKPSYISIEKYLNSNNLNKKGISLVDPLLLDKFNQVYIKERLNVNN